MIFVRPLPHVDVTAPQIKCLADREGSRIFTVKNARLKGPLQVRAYSQAAADCHIAMMSNTDLMEVLGL